MAKLSISVKFYLYPRAKLNGLRPIYCRVTVNRAKTEFSTNETVALSKWSEANQSVKGNPELTGYLITMNAQLRGIHKLYLERGETPTAKMIVDKFLLKDESTFGWLDFVTLHCDDIRMLPEFSKSTFKKYQTVKIHLEKFLTKKRKLDIPLAAVDMPLLSQLEHYLKVEAKLSVNTTGKYLKLLKSIFGKAIRFGHIKRNPFGDRKFKQESTNREFLTGEELSRIEALKLDNASLERVRDIFVFACYSGLRFADVGRLTPKSVIKDQHGKQWLEISQIKKTGDQLRIPLLKKAKTIIDKYDDEPKHATELLPVRSNQKVNAYLKVIADMAKVEKYLTFHMARHTFATTVTLSNNVPIEVVSSMLGHKNIATTKIYAKITNQYMQEYADKLNEML